MEEEKNGNLSQKKYIILAVALLVFLGALIALALVVRGGKKENPEAKHKDIYSPYIDGYFNAGAVRISDYFGLSDEDFERAAVLADNTFNKFHRLFDIYNLYEGINNIKTINDNAGKNPVEIDPELFEFLEFSKEMYYLTDGEVNIAMGAVLSIWHDFREYEMGETLPDMATLEAAAEHTDIEKLILDKENLTAYLSDGEMSLDVGAVAKGYAVEKVGQLLSAEGYDSFLINAGGNIKILGEKPDGSSWKTGIKSPFEPDEVIFEFYLSSASVATSGGYERFYTVDGKKYHHIIDKETLMPAENFASVSVITENAALADTLSTALFNMTLEQGKALILSLENVRAIWVTHEGEIIEN